MRPAATVEEADAKRTSFDTESLDEFEVRALPWRRFELEVQPMRGDNRQPTNIFIKLIYYKELVCLFIFYMRSSSITYIVDHNIYNTRVLI